MSFTHPFFAQDNPPSDWDITRYLEARRAEGTTATGFDKWLNCWCDSLANIAKGTDTKLAEAAQAALKRYKEGGPKSDRNIARAWITANTSPAPAHKPCLKRSSKRSSKPRPKRPKGVDIPQLTLNAGTGTNDVGLYEELEDFDGQSTIASTSSSVSDDTPRDLDDLAAEFQAMDSKTPCGKGEYLENRVYKLATTTTIPYWRPLDIWVLDPKLVLKLEDNERQLVKSQLQVIPQWPQHMLEYTKKYSEVSTIKACLAIAKAETDLFVTEEDPDKLWIDSVMLHFFRLVTGSHNILSLNGLLEGWWDSAFYPTFWDHYFFDIPGLFLQRKECMLYQSPSDTTTQNYRYDAVVRTRGGLGEHKNLAFCLLEVSKSYDGVESKKWKSDRRKLIRGCRAMLSRLKQVVDNDTSTVSRLCVVGVLQAAQHSRVMLVQCIGHNLYYMNEDDVQEFPFEVSDVCMIPKFLEPIWRTKRVISDCHTVVKYYLRNKPSPHTQP